MHNLLLDRENIWYTFDITNETRTFEIPYVLGGVYPVEPLGANLNLMYITETYDSSFNNTNVQNIYVQGRLNDVYTWAKSLKSDITLPESSNSFSWHFKRYPGYSVLSVIFLIKSLV